MPVCRELVLTKAGLFPVWQSPTERHLSQKIVLFGDIMEVVVKILADRKQLWPVGFQRKAVRVEMGWDVDGTSWIRVVEPDYEEVSHNTPNLFLAFRTRHLRDLQSARKSGHFCGREGAGVVHLRRGLRGQHLDMECVSNLHVIQKSKVFFSTEVSSYQ